MANALIDALEFSDRSALGFLEHLAAGPGSANSILKQLGDAGYSIRRQTGLDIIGALRGNVNVQQYARLAGPNAPLPSKYYTQSVTPTKRTFSYRVKIGNQPIGAPGFVNVSSDVELSLNNIFSVVDSHQGTDSGPAGGGEGEGGPDYSLDRATVNPFADTSIQYGSTFNPFEGGAGAVGSIQPGLPEF